MGDSRWKRLSALLLAVSLVASFVGVTSSPASGAPSEVLSPQAIGSFTGVNPTRVLDRSGNQTRFKVQSVGSSARYPTFADPRLSR